MAEQPTTESSESNENLSPANLRRSDRCENFWQLGDDQPSLPEINDEANKLINNATLIRREVQDFVRENFSPPGPPLINSSTTNPVRSLGREGDFTTHNEEVQPPSSTNATTTDDHNQTSASKPKHIMMSYNHDTALEICHKVHQRLCDLGYTVWLDTNACHGSILDSMGDAVDNAYLLLLFINERYAQSLYCTREAKYAVINRVPVIPCMIQEDFTPTGGLGIVKCDLKDIRFFDDRNFEENLQELVEEIKAIEVGLGMRPGSTNTSTFEQRFHTFITRHIESIRQCHLRRGNLSEEDFGHILLQLVEELSPQTLQSSASTQEQNATDNNQLIQHLISSNEALIESIRRQQENYNRVENHLLEQDQRLIAFTRFQEQQDQRVAARLDDQNQRLSSLFRIQQEQREHYTNIQPHISIEREQQQQRNNEISTQLLQHVERMTELVHHQQLLLNRVLDTTVGSVQPEEFQLNVNTLTTLLLAIILFCTLSILLSDR